MAIFYMQMTPISRSTGRSAVAASAYRSAEKLTNERDGLTHDYRHRHGVEHTEIVLPEGVEADWAHDRSTLWNAVERREARKDSRVAREFVLALPHELSSEKRLELTRLFSQDLANRYGAAVDFAIHSPHPQGDVRNHHAHVLMTTRQVSAEGLGDKTYLELANKELLPRNLPTTQMQLTDIRRSWEEMTNRELAREGLDVRIDHRSHSERGLEIEPTEHMGVRATNMQRRGGQVDRGRMDAEAGKRNAELIQQKPDQVLSIIGSEKSVFDRHDIARTLHRYINGDVQEFQNAFAAVMASPELVELQAERTNSETGEIEPARYSTREMVDLENAMAERAVEMKHARSHGVDRHHVDRAIAKQDHAIRASVVADSRSRLDEGAIDGRERDRRVESARLSDEQRGAIAHVTGPERIAAVVGFAGAGKSTMLAAAREAWEAQGYTVHGAALSGKAAEGLEESSGIKSRTLASWDIGWENDKRQLGRGDVFVIDEAGMIGSRQLSRFINEVEARGAKLVMVGDHEQLQAIGAGAPFRAITERIGHAQLTEIRRQRVDWQRDASVAFATHRTSDGLAAYRDNGNIRFAEGLDEARSEIIRDYLSDRDQRPDGTRVAMAHRRADVRAINEAIRGELQERGELARVPPVDELVDGARSAAEHSQEHPKAFSYQTRDGKREFAEGDRIVFLENDRDLGVKNGLLGTVRAVEPNALQVELDGKVLSAGEETRTVRIDANSYQSFDHGYATTIHKTQGATVDRAFVMASATMDRHLTYVAMTRHRDGVQMYADAQEFSGGKAGKLVEHGAAPYEHRQGNRESYFVTVEDDQGQRHTTWGVDLQRAMAEAKPVIGAAIGLEHTGSETVRLPDGTKAERNYWKVHDGEDLAFKTMEQRLSRSGVKETTLDYTKDFAERRGVAAAFGVRSEIDLAQTPERVQEERSHPNHQAWEAQNRSAERSGVGPEPQLAGSERLNHPDPVHQVQRRSPFAGLKLGRGGAAEPPPSRGRSESAQERPQQAAVPKRGMFAGLKLSRAQEPAMPSGAEVAKPVEERQAPSPVARPSGLERSVDRFAHAFSAAAKMQERGLPVLDSQKTEMHTALQQMEQARPGSSELMASALRHDPEMERILSESSGRDRVGQLIGGMEKEKALQADPNVRADRLIDRWQELQEEREGLRGWQHGEARGKVEGEMREMAATLKNDPAMESIVKDRARELGIAHVRESQGIAGEMERQVAKGRSQGMER